MKDEDINYEATVILAIRPDMTNADARWVGALSLSHKARGADVAQLRDRVAKLETALRSILDDGCSSRHRDSSCDSACRDVARAALGDR